MRVGQLPRGVYSGLEEAPEPPPPKRPWPWPAILTVGAWLAGWLLVTAGLAEVLTRWLWLISLGVLLLGLGGARPLLLMLRDGLLEWSDRAKARKERGVGDA